MRVKLSVLNDLGEVVATNEDGSGSVELPTPETSTIYTPVMDMIPDGNETYTAGKCDILSFFGFKHYD